MEYDSGIDRAPSLYEHVQNVLETDHEHTRIGDTGDLFPFREIDFTREAMHPIGRGHFVRAREDDVRRFLDRHITSNAIDRIEQRLDQKLAGVAQFMKAGRERGLVVAGGGVSAYIIHDTPRPDKHLKDMDFFAVGYETDAEVAELVNAFGAAFAEWTGRRVYVVRTLRCITFSSTRETPFQVILKLYTNISEILHGFDIAPCAVAYDGRELWTTALGAFAYTTGIIPVDLTRRRESFEYRLEKYFKRGYGLFLPGMRPPEDLETPFSLARGRLRFRRGAMRAEDTTRSAYEADGLLKGGRPCDAIHVSNVRGLRTGNAHALKASCYYARGIDVTAVPVVLEEKSLTTVFNMAFGLVCGKMRTRWIYALLGDEAGEVIRQVSEEDFVPDINRYVRATLERYAGVCPGALPFECMPPTHGLADQGPLARSPMDPRDWYGEHYDDWYDDHRDGAAAAGVSVADVSIPARGDTPPASDAEAAE